MDEAVLIQGARDFLLVSVGSDTRDRYFLDGTPLNFEDELTVERLFREGVFTYDHNDINSMAESILVRVKRAR